MQKETGWHLPGMLKNLTPFIILTCFFILTAYRQQERPPAIFNGKWITADKQTAFEIISDSIRPLYKQEGGKWQQTYWRNENSIFDTAAIINNDTMYESRALRTSIMKLYLVSGGIKIEYVNNYSFNKIERVNKNSIRLRVSGAYTLYRDKNTNPDEYSKKEQLINDHYAAGKMAFTSYVLYRLKE